MIGLEFDFEVAALRKDLLFNYQIFTGAASNKKTAANSSAIEHSKRTF